jgi:hypothetical protein
MTKDIPVYKITIEDEFADGENLGIEMIAFTKTPAIKVKGMAFSADKKMIFSDDLKYRITAPAMIPMDIYRNNNEDGEYYVQFTAEVIDKIHSKFMADLRNRDIFNLEHDTDKKVPAYILDIWTVDNPTQDKAFSTFGMEVPQGTLMMTVQVTDKDYYNKLVEDGQIGLSIEGFLGLKLSQQLKLNKMQLPDGEYLIEDKIYVVKGGEVLEIKEMEKEETAEVVEEEMAAEPVAMEDTKVEETVTEDSTITDEEMAIDPTADAEAILAIVLPVIEEREKALIAMLADLRNQMEEMYGEKEVEVEATDNKQKMSVQAKFSAVSKFLNLNNQ